MKFVDFESWKFNVIVTTHNVYLYVVEKYQKSVHTILIYRRSFYIVNFF